MCMQAVYDMKELAKFKSGVMFGKGRTYAFKSGSKFVGTPLKTVKVMPRR